MNLKSRHETNTTCLDKHDKQVPFLYKGELLVRTTQGPIHVGAGEQEYECFSLTSHEVKKVRGAAEVEPKPKCEIYPDGR